MSDKPDAVAVRQPIFSLVPGSLGEAMEMAKLITSTELCPKAYRGKPADAIIAYDFGRALGLSWMQSVRNIASINGVPALYGDAVPAVVMGTRECEQFKEWIDGDGDTRMAHCLIRRKGYPDDFHKTFSVADAKRANLWGKAGPWSTYPDRMLQWRATGFSARAAFPDKLSGLILAEEANDYPKAIDATVVASEPVVTPLDLLNRVSDGLRDRIGKAFAELKMSAPTEGTPPWKPTGLGVTKLTEYLADKSVMPDEGAEHLLRWCEDEYAKRRTGQPLKRDADNGKKKPAPDHASPPSVPPAGSSSPASAIAPPAQDESAAAAGSVADTRHSDTPQPDAVLF